MKIEKCGNVFISMMPSSPYTKFQNFKVKHVVHENVVGGISLIGFPLVAAIPERDMLGIKPGPLGWHTSTLTNDIRK
jgi:hypothetical protein